MNAEPRPLSPPRFTILIPALDEAVNSDSRVRRVLETVQSHGLDAEVLFVDRGSADDILRTAEKAATEFVVVMDADLSHSPEAIPSLVRPLVAGTHDIVIGSRNIAEDQTPGTPWTRRLASRGAAALAWPLVNARDPMSGLFAVRRETLLDLGGEGTGGRIVLEILARGGDALRVQEVPITVHEPERRRSKLSWPEKWTCLKQILALAGNTVSTDRAPRFAAVGLVGVVVDLLLFNVLLSIGVALLPAQLASFTVAAILTYLLNTRWTFADAPAGDKRIAWGRRLSYLAIGLLGLILRGSILAALVQTAQWSPRMAILPAIAAAAMVFLIGTAFFVFPQAVTRTTTTIRWRVFTIAMLGYVLLLRLVFSSAIDLIPEEAYYWLYSQHPALSYFDHPPMVAWLIGASTWLLGRSEIAVRLPALLCWGVVAAFMFGLGRNLFGKTTAFCTVLFMAALPIYCGIGMLMTPDAPLYAAWAGCLYFLERALIAQKRGAWWGVGVCLGLGMLSKYTIALLGPAILVFVLLDQRSRRWLVRPEPYLAAVTSALLFSPVILWNANHGWASFVFQGPRRWSGAPEFSLHLLIAWALLLITPLGFLGVAKVLLPRWAGGQSPPDRARPFDQQRKLFAQVFTLAPLLVFILHSLQNEPKLNWTGPVWLAALPLLAWSVTSSGGRAANWLAACERSLWRPNLVMVLLLYGGGIYYLLLGLPGQSSGTGMAVPSAWEEMVNAVDQVEERIEAHGGDPVIVGMHKYFISSEYAFYDPNNDGLEEASGPHLFGENSLMWAYWKPTPQAIGANIMLIAFKPAELSNPKIDCHFDRITDIIAKTIEKDGRPAGRFYYRIGYDYHSRDAVAGESRQNRLQQHEPRQKLRISQAPLTPR